MAINKAWCTGTSALLDWYDSNAQSPYYSVWRGRNLSFSWNNDDMEAGRQKLENDINFAEQNNVTEVLTIKLHPKKDKGYITNSTPVYASLDFRPCALESAVYGLPVSAQPNNYAMSQIMDKLNALESRIAGSEMDFEEEEDNKPESPINALLNNPDVHQALVSGLLGLIGGMFTHTPQVPVSGIAGINDEAVEILNELMNKGVTLEHLKKLAQMNEAKLKSLLIML
jgi:hypothetical protein